VAFAPGEGAYYENSSEYVHDVIRRDMQRAAAIAGLREEIEIGRKSGKPRLFDSERSGVRR
jgi:Arc/MetJ-type ribon-helix-helix transcriptional regulator